MLMTFFDCPLRLVTHTPFVTCRNQLSIGVLLDAQGQVANHVGVLCEVNQMPPAMFHKLLHR